MNTPPLAASRASTPLYEVMASRMAALITSGAFQPGQRLPSVRDTAAQEGVSISTAAMAFRCLEDLGLVLAKPKSGYWVRKKSAEPRIALPLVGQPPLSSMAVTRPMRKTLMTDEDAVLGPLLSQPSAHAGVATPVANFGGYSPARSALFDEERLRIALARAVRVHRHSLVSYRNTAGVQPLQNAVAQRALHLGCALRGEDIVITASSIQAIYFCLLAVTSPGDVVALESPTFFGFLDLLESMGLRVVEIPAHPRSGMSLPALQLALDTQPIKAVLAVPTLSNPLGSVMSLGDKKALVDMLTRARVPLIEDVVFNDLLASDARRRAAKAFDTGGWVMVCGSFSKTLTPGIRLGWVEAGCWGQRVAQLKSEQGAATNAVLEHALADLLTQSAYESQMRRLSATMKARLQEARQLIRTSFPAGTRVSNPPAGYTLWVELPKALSSTALFERANAQGLVFRPGSLFSASDRYEHCLRLSFSGAWGPPQKAALARLGDMARALQAGGLDL